MSDVGNPFTVEAVGDPESLAGKITRAARMLVEHSTDDAPIVGFVSLAVFSDGRFSMGFQCPENHPFMGPSLFTAYVREIIDREMTGRMAASDYAKENLL